MANLAQDMVCSIPGAGELLHKTNEILHDTTFVIKHIERGFQAHVEGLPYFFTVSCFEDIGWNVFLTTVNGTIEDDEETDGYYHALEDAVDIINATYFSEDEENESISYNFFKLKAVTEATIGQSGTMDVIEDQARYVLRVGLDKGNEKPIEMGYSKLFRRWYYEIKNKENIQQLLNNHSVRGYLEEVDYMIENFNQSM